MSSVIITRNCWHRQLASFYSCEISHPFLPSFSPFFWRVHPCGDVSLVKMNIDVKYRSLIQLWIKKIRLGSMLLINAEIHNIWQSILRSLKPLRLLAPQDALLTTESCKDSTEGWGFESGPLAVRDGIKEGNRLLIERELWKKLSLGCSVVLLFICTIQFGNECWNIVLKYCLHNTVVGNSLLESLTGQLEQGFNFIISPQICVNTGGKKKSFVSLSWEVSDYI